MSHDVIQECTPAGTYQTLPSYLYTNPDVYAKEVESVFRSSWQLVGHVSDIPKTGEYFTADVSGVSIVVMRGQDDIVRGFFNSCIHRGHELTSGSGCVKKLTCPYHAWTYDTTGRLRAAPNARAFPGFDVKDHQLRETQLEVFHGLILVNLDPNAKPFSEWVDLPHQEIDDFAPNLANYVHAARTERLAKANWKVVAENFNECYHCAVVHKTLTTGVVDPDAYRTRRRAYGIRHESPARPDSQKSYSYVADPDARTDKFLTWWFWPLFALQVYPGGIVNTYRWRPLSVNETKIEVDWWLPQKEPNAVEQEIIMQHRTTTFAEDGPIVDAVQRGMEVGGFQSGPVLVDEGCSSMSEHPIVAFHDFYRDMFPGAAEA